MVANPRLIDALDLGFTQEQVDFAIPHLREDIPLAIDPFLLWKSDRPEYRSLHERLLAFLGLVRDRANSGDAIGARRLLAACTEPRALGLGYALGSKRGSSLGPGLIEALLAVLREVPTLREGRITHLEVLSLLVPGIAEDRISDVTAAVLQRFLIDFTRERAKEYRLPTARFAIDNVWDGSACAWKSERTDLPQNPTDGSPLLLAPLDLLRHLPWINYDDYYASTYARLVLPADYAGRKIAKSAVLAYNRAAFRIVEGYVSDREQSAAACQPDPLFEPLQLATLRRKFETLRALSTGKEDGQDKEYERLASELLGSLLYPELELAASQVRTVSGAHIRDLLFYNDGKTELLRDLRSRYEARQPVFELKNAKQLTSEHVNQLHRYLDEEFGRFGVLVSRNPLPASVRTNIVDLHSSKRVVVLAIDDTDLALMLSLLESGRRPVEALKKRYVEFTRWLPK